MSAPIVTELREAAADWGDSGMGNRLTRAADTIEALLGALEECVAELTELYGEILPDTKLEGRERVENDPTLVRSRAAIAKAEGTGA